MTNNIVSQLDIVIYLVPGYAVTLAMLYAYAPERLRAQQHKLGIGEIVASVLAALLVGIAIHCVSAVLLEGAGFIYGEHLLGIIIQDFEHLPEVKSKLEGYLGLSLPDHFNTYFYARTWVDEKASRTAVTAERLYNMSLLCRNMLVAIPLASLLTLKRLLLTTRKRLAVTSLLLTVVALEGAFLQGLRFYWSSAVWRTLRAVLVVD